MARSWVSGLATLALLAGCADPPLLSLSIVTPDEGDPLAGVNALRLVVTNPQAESSLVLSDASHFTIPVETEVQGAIGAIILEGFEGSTLRARGETPPFAIAPEQGELALLVAKAGALSRLRPQLDGPAEEMTTSLLSTWGVLLAGGQDAHGAPQAAAYRYDFFQHQLRPLPPLPAARSGAVAASCSGQGTALLATGQEAHGLATQLLRLVGDEWDVLEDGLAPEQRRSAAAGVRLSDGTYLVIGGQGSSGALATLLHLDPGECLEPHFELLPHQAVAARVSPAVAAVEGFVLVAGGQARGKAPAELIDTTSFTSRALSLPGPQLAAAAAAVELGDGRLALLGGRDESGKLLRDGWIIEPSSLQVLHVPEALRQGRVHHQVARVGDQLIVLGGTSDAGLASEAEVLSAADLRLESTTPMREPRQGLAALPLGQGSLLVAGGASSLEVYETAITSQ